MSETGHVERIVALGASNLTRGLPSVISTARTLWGPDIEVVAAFGNGRSYGAESSFLCWRFPAILDSGLWRHLERAPSAPTRALVTDVGNDILYQFSASRILAWVDESVSRLQQVTGDIVVTGLPPSSVTGVSPAKFYFFRTMFVPSCRLSLQDVVQTAVRVDAGLEEIAARRGARYIRLPPHWYGVDPIHIRPRWWRAAWQQILGTGHETAVPVADVLPVYAMRRERQWLFGVEKTTPQRGRRLKRGARVWLF